MTSPSASRDFLESGCALIIATVGPDLAPHASRGWGLAVLAEDQLRLLVDAGDAQLRTNLMANGVVAVTASSVRTLRSMQLKGRVTGPEPGTTADLECMQQYCDCFFADVAETDGVPTHLLQRIVPAEVVAYSVVVDAMFDQTPGPQAGAALGS